MKILIIGGNGTIGKRVVQELEEENEVVVVGRTSGEVQVDIADSASIKNMFEKVGNIDALICLAGEAKWDTFNSLSEEDFYIGLKSKLMGQVNLVRMGQEYLSKNGSITLTTGVLADDPVVMTTSAAMVNGAIHSFVKAVALELEDIRVNAVCSGLVEDSVAKYQSYFKGHNPVPMKKVVNAYLKSIFGRINGQVIRVYE